MAAAGQPELIVAADAEALAQAAAERVMARIAANAGRIAICLTGGSSPKKLYQLLGGDAWRGKIPWDRVHWFIGDERFVAASDPLSNFGMARRLFLERVGVPFHTLHPVPTDATSSLEGASRLYEAALKDFYAAERLEPGRPLFALVLMGLGSDGHTASLFPNSPALHEQRRWVVGVEQAGLAPFVPRVTLTFPTLASAREMLFLVSGEEKREILARVLSGDDLPAGRACCEGELVWLVDRAARGASR
jgi:6-phosphogluconolactonase